MTLPAILEPLMTMEFGFLVFAAALSGMVRGFSGFGTGLIFIPMAAIVLDPLTAVATVALMDIAGPVPVIVSTRRDIHFPDLRRLVIGLVVAVPLGLAALSYLAPEVFRITASMVSLLMLMMLLTGWRYERDLPRWGVTLTGAASGFLGGVAGIPGPPVIFAYMASRKPVRVIRANISAFLFCFDACVIIALWVTGQLSLSLVVMGVALVAPNMVGNLLGAALFRPEQERVFRGVAYILIAAAAFAGLPVWN